MCWLTYWHSEILTNWQWQFPSLMVSQLTSLGIHFRNMTIMLSFTTLKLISQIKTSMLRCFTRFQLNLYHSGFVTEGTVVLREKLWCKTSQIISNQRENRCSVFRKSLKSSYSIKKEYSHQMSFDIHLFYVEFPYKHTDY